MKKHVFLSAVLIPAVLLLALFSACDNSFVNSILPDRTEKVLDEPPSLTPPGPTEPIEPTEPTEPEPPGPTEPTGPDAITIKIMMTGNVGTDNVTASPAAGKAGDEITINYTVANNKVNNRLAFSGTKTGIAEVDSAETGTRKYTIAGEDAADGVITINATFTHSDKTLDTIAFADTSNITKTYGDPSFTKAISNAGSGSGAISYVSSDTTVATVSSGGAVTILKAGTTEITATKAEDATYAEATAAYNLTVEKKSVTITGLYASNKTYDGTPAAAVSGSAAIAGIVGSDDVTVTSGTAAFADKNVGTGKTVTFSGYSLSGADAGNYTLSAQPANAAVNITALQLTIANPTITTSKAYDSTTDATVTAGALTNKISTDTVNVTAAGTYSAATVGSSTITVVYNITGADAGNYIRPDNYTTSGTITRATGRPVSAAPTLASRTTESITVNAVTVQMPDYGQTVEYAISTGTSAPSTGWQSGTTFSGLSENTNYYVFARSKANDNCEAGTAVSVAIKTDAPPTAAGIKYDFSTDTLPIEYLDTGNGGMMQVGFSNNGSSSFKGEISGGVLKIEKTGSNTTASFLLPFNLGTENLSSYNSVKINIRGVNGGSTGNDYTYKSLIVYLNNSSTAIGTLGGANLDTNFQDKIVPLTGSRSATGAIVIGISMGQSTGYTIEIKSIELVK